MSIKILSAFLYLILSIEGYAKNENLWQRNLLIRECQIFSMIGTPLKNFPGQFCVFLDNGRFITGNEESLRMIDDTSKVVWEIPGYYHHQINLSRDKKRIIALASDFSTTKEGTVRQDKFLIISMDGKILHQQLTLELFKQTHVQNLDWPLSPSVEPKYGKGYEISHFNSFYEIPAIKTKNKPSYFKEGNYIVNSVAAGVFILSPDLSKVLQHLTFNNSYEHHVHDVQVTSRGNYLYFNNEIKNGSGIQSSMIIYPLLLSSGVFEIDPVNQKMVNSFQANPLTAFYSYICGSVQELDGDTWLISHFLMGTYIYSKSKKSIIHATPYTHRVEDRHVPTQQVKAQDLSLFLKSWNQ